MWQGTHGHCQEPTGSTISWEGMGNGPIWGEPQGHHSPRHIQVTPAAALVTTLCPCHVWLLLHSHCRAATLDNPKSLSATAQMLQDLLTAPSREPVGLGLGWKGTKRHSERGTLPLFSPAPIPEQAWAAWSLPAPQIPGSTIPWAGMDPPHPRLWQPWHGRWGRWALAVPEGLSAGGERAASLLHDCVCRAGLGEAVVPSSSLSCWADGCPLAAPAPGSVPTGPAPEGRWWHSGGTLVASLATWHAAATGEPGGRSAPLPSAAINPGCVPHAGSHTAEERLVHCSTPWQRWHGGTGPPAGPPPYRDSCPWCWRGLEGSRARAGLSTPQCWCQQ